MQGSSRTRATGPSKRMRHGLRSRARSEERIYEAHDLMTLLARPAPSCPLVMDAAADVADTVLHLREVQAAMLALLSPPAEEAGHGTPGSEHDLLTTLQRMREHATETRRLMTYERKILSRRNKAINRLDYLVLEARRREQDMMARDRALGGKLDLADFR